MTATDTTTPSAVARRPAPRARIGVFGIGLAAYWPQFSGLKERIEGYQRRVEERVAELGGEVVSAGLVDSEQAAREAGDRFAAARVDLVLCHAVTYATSNAGHIRIGQGARIGVQAGVMSDVRAGATLVGSPAQPRREFFRQVAALKRMTRRGL